jgi:hypothetical protein
MAVITNFGVPVDGSVTTLMPKLQYRFRVAFTGLGNGSPNKSSVTQNVISTSRPNLTHEEVVIDSYNSKMYLAGKHTWEPIVLNLREDVNNNVQKLVGEQLQKQFDFYEQSSAASGADYKFVTRIEILDGGNGANVPNVLETFELYGCYVEAANYNSLAYSNSTDPVSVTLNIRYDNAIQSPQGTGIGTAIGRTTNTSVTGGGV